jgi:SesB domain on fungal death-pathway protein
MSSALTAEAVDEMKATIHDAISRTQPDLEVQIEEINYSLDSLTFESPSLSNCLHDQTGESISTQLLEDREKALEEDNRLALEAEKKAMEQSQKVCTIAEQRIGGARPQLESRSVNVTFSGANNSGFQVGQNIGNISNLRWGADS